MEGPPSRPGDQGGYSHVRGVESASALSPGGLGGQRRGASSAGTKAGKYDMLGPRDERVCREKEGETNEWPASIALVLVVKLKSRVPIRQISGF